MNEREIVLEALLQFYKGDEYAGKVLDDVLSKYSYLEKQERSFINRLFDGVIERQITLDFIINEFSSVKVNKQKPVIRAILRMAVYQIFYMDSVPDFAAINESVKLAKRKKFANLSGFVNGVLRNISKERADIKFPAREKDFIKYLSVNYSCPEWLCEHFMAEAEVLKTGEADIRELCEKIISASIDKPVLYGRVNLSKISREAIIDRLKEDDVIARPVETSECAVVLENVDSLMYVDAFDEGLFVIQDLSSQQVIGGADIKDDMLVVDVCASPGGKTLHALDKGARVIARDISEFKANRIIENIEKCGFTKANVEVRDALDFDPELEEKADIVIADLPCSGLGVIGRKSDIKYRITKEDLIKLSNLQKEILKVVHRYVKPGGVLIYSTCTVDKLENEDNVKFIEENLPFEKAFEVNKMIQGISETDGFFISRFQRKL